MTYENFMHITIKLYIYIYIYILHLFNFFKLNTIKFKAFLNNRSEWS
jgi:hypothetical protein